MHNLARATSPTTSQEPGIVTRADHVLLVRTDTGTHRARRATSCLVEPQLGDYVLLGIVGTRDSYVLAILERDDDTNTCLSVAGDLEIKLSQGSLGITAAEGVRLTSPKDVSVVSAAVSVRAAEGNVALQRLSYVGRFVHAKVEKIKTFAGSLDSVLDRFSQRVKRSYRTVEQIDQLKAERIDYTAKQVMRLHSRNAVVTAEQLVKVDGEQIYPG